MENALIKKEGKGWRITFADGKSLPISWSQIPSDWDGKNIEVLRDKGQVVKMVFEAKEITKQTVIVNQAQSQNNMAQTYEERKPAKAPYNFVPLNNKTIKGQGEVDFSHYNGKSGYIDLTITNKTPLFIRGKDENFLMVNNEPTMPGSSLRGLIRTLVEVVSFGKFINYFDRSLYWRKPGRNAASNRQIGFLIFDNADEKYIIYEASNHPDPLNARNKEFEYEFIKSGISATVNIYSGEMGRNNFKILYEKNNHHHYIDNKIIKSYVNDDNRNADGSMKNLIEEIKISSSVFKQKFNEYNASTTNKIAFIGIPVWYETGKVGEKKEVIHFGHCKNYRIPYEFSIGSDNHIRHILQDPKLSDFAENIFGTTENAGRVFFEDALLKNGSGAVTLPTKVLKILSTPKPTTFQHYLEQKPLSFKTPAFQLKHWGNASALIRGYKLYWHRNTNLQSNDGTQGWNEVAFKVDRKGFIAFLLDKIQGKNRFNVLWEFARDYREEIDINNIPTGKLIINGDLATLEPKFRNLVINFFNLDKNECDRLQISKPQNTIATPIENATFTSRIRFENLTREELGCLLFVLDLPKGCCHKLGMGKPLGLGSVEIKPTLTIINRKERYGKLFDDNGNWNTGETNEANLDEYKDAFAQHINKELNNKKQPDSKYTFLDLWKIERLQQLKTMLTFDDKVVAGNDWLEETRYMDMNKKEYKNRPVLPTPKEVVELFNKKKSNPNA